MSSIFQNFLKRLEGVSYNKYLLISGNFIFSFNLFFLLVYLENLRYISSISSIFFEILFFLLSNSLESNSLLFLVKFFISKSSLLLFGIMLFFKYGKNEKNFLSNLQIYYLVFC